MLCQNYGTKSRNFDMKTESESQERREMKAEALRQAAKIAEAEQSPLAAELWNEACHRIQELLRAEAVRIEHS
jgi:hypothetical protein